MGTEEGEAKACAEGVVFTETSAKAYASVEVLFDSVAESIIHPDAVMSPSLVAVLQEPLDCSELHFLGMHGEELAALSVNDQGKVQMGGVRSELATRLGMSKRRLKIVLPSGRLLAPSEDQRPLSEFFSIGLLDEVSAKVEEWTEACEVQ